MAIGKRKTDYEDESTSEVLKKAKSLKRTDWGGSSDPVEVIIKKMGERGIKCGPQSAAAIKEIAEEQVAGVGKRMFPRIDEAIRRLGQECGESAFKEELP